VRTLDAIHLASALHVDADELLAYDTRLLAAAAEHGLLVASPGT
jgi:predicted nucleic acid-binding protein